MSIIIDKLFFKPEIDNGINKINYLQWDNIYPALIALLVLRTLNLPSSIILIGGFITFYYYSTKNAKELNEKLSFLNSILFEDNEEPFNQISFLEYEPKLTDFFFDIKYYIDDNLTAYRKSLLATNNILRYGYNLENNLMQQPEQLYTLILQEYKEALNNFQSLIYKLTSHQVNNDLFQRNMEKLKNLLDKQLEKAKIKIKDGYNKYDLNIWSLPNPNNLELANDIKDKNYSPHYSFF